MGGFAGSYRCFTRNSRRASFRGKTASDFERGGKRADSVCAKLCANEWSCGFLHMLIWQRQGHWELLDIRIGADRCVLLKEYPDIYQLWADGMCEEMERASAQKK